MLRVSGLRKCYGDVCPIKDLSFDLREGIWVIYGPNGSGKTTLMSLLSGVASPTSGDVHVEGSVSYMPQEPMLYEEYKVKDYVTLLKSSGDDWEILTSLLNSLGINLDSHVYSLSYGTKKALFMGIILATRADVYLLDEPFLGVDSERRGILLKYLLSRAKGKIAIVTESERILKPTHVMSGGALVEAVD